MAKKSQRRPLRYDTDQAGCIWGFISFFDFRHGRTTHRLLSDRRRFTRQVVGAGCSKPNLHMPTNSNENPEGLHEGEERDTIIADSSKTSVKELMEEEMFIEKDCINQNPDDDIQSKGSESESKARKKKNRRRKSKSSKSLTDICEVDASQSMGAQKSCQQDSEDRASQKLDLEIVATDIFQQIYQKSTTTTMNVSNNEIDLQIEQRNPVFDNKLSEAIRLFVDRRSRDGEIDYLKEFMDALQTLSLNKELILDLLKDPNSLLVKHIEALEDAQLEKGRNGISLNRSKLFDGGLTDSKKRHNFFRRRCKSEEKIRLSGDKNCQTPNRIVILKPGSPFQSPDDLGTKEQTERLTSQFSFAEIKRRLKNAMGKERNGVSSNDSTCRIPFEHQNSGNGDKGIGGDKGGWNSPNRNHFYIEKFARPMIGIRNKDRSYKQKSTETTVGNETVENTEKRVSNIYIEAKRHLSEMLRHGDETGNLSNRQSPKALGKMLSLPEFNFSPVSSPRENEHHFVTAKQRLSRHNNFHMASEDMWKPALENDVSHMGSLKQNLDSQLSDRDSPILDELNHASAEGGTLSSVSTEKNSEDDVAILQTIDAPSEVLTTNVVLQEEGEVSDVSTGQCSSAAVEDNRTGDVAETCDEEEKLDSLEQEQLLCSPLASPSSSSITKHIGNSDAANERLERPSPISVLEPFFTEDDISPASIKFQPVEPQLQPLRIQFEEQLSSANNQELCAIPYLDDEESAFEYVEAVLLASDLNLNEFRLRWLSSVPILDQSLFDEVELFSSRSPHDQMLLFDCTNEVLNEFCDGYFGYFPRVSFVKHNIRPIPRGMELIREVWEGVEWHFLPQSSPRTMDHIVRREMENDGKWMDLRYDVEGIAYEIEELIFEELVEDTSLRFLNEDPEIGSSILLTEFIDIE